MRGGRQRRHIIDHSQSLVPPSGLPLSVDSCLCTLESSPIPCTMEMNMDEDRETTSDSDVEVDEDGPPEFAGQANLSSFVNMLFSFLVEGTQVYSTLPTQEEFKYHESFRAFPKEMAQYASILLHLIEDTSKTTMKKPIDLSKGDPPLPNPAPFCDLRQHQVTRPCPRDALEVGGPQSVVLEAVGKAVGKRFIAVTAGHQRHRGERESDVARRAHEFEGLPGGLCRVEFLCHKFCA